MLEQEVRTAVDLFNRAVAAGNAALTRCVPRPMTVVGGAPGEPPKEWYVEDGLCGFAWVTVFPASCLFIRAMKKAGLAGETQVWSKAYGGGYHYWVHGGNQSYERKMAFAKAMALVLQEGGVKAYAGGRLD